MRNRITALPRMQFWHVAVALAAILLIAFCDLFRPYGLQLSHFYVVAILYLAWLVPGRVVWYFAAAVVCLAVAVPLSTGRDYSNRIDGSIIGLALSYLVWDRQRFARRLAASNVGMSSQLNEQVATLQNLNEDLKGQIEQRSTVEASLRDSEARYRNLVELSPDAILVVQADQLVFANHAAARIIGAAHSDELLGRKLTEVIDPAQHALHYERKRAFLDSGEMLPPLEYRVRRMDGSWTYVEVLAGPCRFRNSEAIQLVVRDLTDSKRLASELRKLSDFREKVIATASEGISVCTETPDSPFNEFSIWNDHMTELTGYTMEEVNRLGFRKAVQPVSAQPADASVRIERMWAGDDLRAEPWTITRKDGARRTLAISTSRVETDDGRVAVIALMHDVTERAVSEELLRQSESSFRGVVEAIPDLIFRIDRQGYVNYVKSEPADDLLLPPDAIFGQHFRTFLPPTITAGFDAAITRATQNANVQSFDYDLDLPDGRRQSFEARIVAIAEGGAVIVARNVTEQRLAIESLRESELRFRQLAENIREVFWLASPDNREIIYISPAYEELVGRSCASLYANPRSWLELVHPDDREMVESGLPQQAEAGYDREYRIIRPDGEVRWVRDRTFPVHDEHGTVLRVVGLAEDITNRKQVEEELRENQERLRLAVQAANMGPWDWNVQTGAVVFSPEWKRHLGYEVHEIASRYEEWESRLHPDDRDPVLESLRAYFDGQQPEYAVEFRLRHKDGSWRWIDSRGVVLRDAEGQPTRMLGCHVDITARKRAEALLIGQKQVLELAAMGAPLAKSLHELTQLIENHSPGMLCSILLLDRKGLHLRHGAAPSLQPDYVAAIDGIAIGPSVGSCGTAAYLREPVFVEDVATDLRWQDYKTLALSSGLRACWSTPILDAQKQVLGTFAMYYRHPALPTVEDRSLIDVATQTAAVVIGRHRMEATLRESENRLRTLLENLENVAVQAYEADGTITFWNRASERLYGFAAMEAIGKDIVTLLHGEKTAGEERRIMAEAIRTGSIPAADEVEVVRKDGTRALIIASRILHRRRDKPPEFFCFDVDISDRKRAEEELAARQAELLHASRLSTVGQMVAALSHEVAQPLTAIGNFAAASAKVLSTETPPPADKLAQYVQAIAKQNERCSAILDRLRNFSRRTPMRRSCHEINNLLHESADLVYSDLRRDGVDIYFDCNSDLPPVMIDKIQIQQVLVNLLSNARDAARNQSVDRRCVTIRSRSAEASVFIDVEDRGEGLSDELREQIFEPFFTTKEGGMGIGLSISRRIAREHGGDIVALPNAHRGATFRVSLPLE